MGSGLEVLRLNLLSAVGRSFAAGYRVRIVPVTLLFDGRGQLLARYTGVPDATAIQARLAAHSARSTPLAHREAPGHRLPFQVEPAKLVDAASAGNEDRALRHDHR